MLQPKPATTTVPTQSLCRLTSTLGTLQEKDTSYRTNLAAVLITTLTPTF